jgi:acetoin utilization protein AcuB
MGKPTVEQHMTVSPVVIGIDRTIADARRIMRDQGIRHLPVVDAGRLVGLVSQRDLYLAETMRGVDPARDGVREAMTADLYAVPPDAPLGEVAATMAERRIGSAIVVDRGSVIGLFSTVDALRALAELSGGRGPRGRAGGRTRV